MLRDPARSLALVLAVACGALHAVAAPSNPPTDPPIAPPSVPATPDSGATGVTDWAPEAAFDTLRVDVHPEPPMPDSTAAALADRLAPLDARRAALVQAGSALGEADRKVLSELVAASSEMTTAGDEEAARLLFDDALRFYRERSK